MKQRNESKPYPDGTKTMLHEIRENVKEIDGLVLETNYMFEKGAIDVVEKTKLLAYYALERSKLQEENLKLLANK